MCYTKFKSLISFVFLLTSLNLLQAQELLKKWYPGHYLYVSPRTFDEPMDESNRAMVRENPYFTGYHARYHWKALETSKDVYDFSIIEQDIETARLDGKKLIVHLHDRDHTGQKVPIPDYLTTDPIYEGGYYRAFDTAAGREKIMPKYWVPAFAERLGELIIAFGNRFDQDTILAYVCIEETALIGSKDQPGFSSSKLKDSYKVIYSAAAEGLPNTIFSQYANWPGGLTRADADEMMAHLVSLRHGMGGPDALSGLRPFDGVSTIGALENWFGRYYTLYNNIMPVTSSSQAPSFKVNTPLTVLNYAIDNLNSHFMSWATQRKETDPNNLFGIVEIIEMVTAEKGRINTIPPASILSSFNPDSLTSRDSANIEITIPGIYTSVQAALAGEWTKLTDGGSLTVNVSEGVFYAPSAGNSLLWPGKRINVIVQGVGAGKTIMRPFNQNLTQRIAPLTDGTRWMELTGSSGMDGSTLLVKDMTFQYMGSYQKVIAAGCVFNFRIDQSFEATIENVVFDNCVGLAIVNNPRGNTDLIIDNCLFKECVSTERENGNAMRGLIAKDGGSLTVRNTTFYSNENQDSNPSPSLNGFAVNAGSTATYPAMEVVLENNSFVNNLNKVPGYNVLSPVVALKPDGTGVYYLSALNNIFIGNRRTGEENDVDLYISNTGRLLISESSGNLLTRSVSLVSAGVYEDFLLEGSLVNAAYTYTHPDINFTMDGELPVLSPDFHGIGKMVRLPLNTKNLKNPSFRVYTVNNVLRMEGLTPGISIQIYNLSGSPVINYTAATDHFETELSKGFYLVRAGNESYKTIVF
jgi:hypothetical protein